MKRINVALLVITLAGVAMLSYQKYLLFKIQPEFQRLSARYGAMPIIDPDQFKIVRIDTGDPRQFSWRFYVPANTSLTERVDYGSQGYTSRSGSLITKPTEFLIRCRFEFKDDGLMIDTFGPSGDGATHFHGASFEFLKSHWDEMLIEPLESTTLPVDQLVPFLKIKFPDDLSDQQKHDYGIRSETLFQLIMGTTVVVEQYVKNKSKKGRRP